MILEEPAVCIRAVCVQPTCTACIVCVCSTLLPIIEWQNLKFVCSALGSEQSFYKWNVSIFNGRTTLNFILLEMQVLNMQNCCQNSE